MLNSFLRWHHSVLCPRKLVANLTGNLLIIGKTYNVTCVKRPKMNTNSWRSFSEIFWTFVQFKEKVITFQSSFFQNNFYGTNFTWCFKKHLIWWYWQNHRITLHLFCIKMFLEAISTRRRSLKKFHRMKLEKLFGKKEKESYLLTK